MSIASLYIASGFGVGLLVGLTGVGGGSLMTPLLILLFGIHPSTAVGTDLLYAAATKTGGSIVHNIARSIHWPAVLRLASGSIPASAGATHNRAPESASQTRARAPLASASPISAASGGNKGNK